MKNKAQNQFFNNNKKMSNINDKKAYIKLMNNFYDSNLTTNDFKDDEFNDIVSDFITLKLKKLNLYLKTNSKKLTLILK